jgi:hypothetical protein
MARSASAASNLGAEAASSGRYFGTAVLAFKLGDSTYPAQKAVILTRSPDHDAFA